MYDGDYIERFPEWGQKVPHFHYLGAESAPGIQKWLHFAPPFFEIWNLNKITMKSEHKKWWQKAPPHIINKGFKGKIPCWNSIWMETSLMRI